MANVVQLVFFFAEPFDKARLVSICLVRGNSVGFVGTKNRMHHVSLGLFGFLLAVRANAVKFHHVIGEDKIVIFSDDFLQAFNFLIFEFDNLATLSAGKVIMVILR